MSVSEISLMAAQFTRMSILPNFCAASSTNAVTEAIVEMSTPRPEPQPPPDVIAPTVLARPASSMSPAATQAPSFAKRSAIAWPIPDAAPVTIIFLPSSRMSASRSQPDRLHFCSFPMVGHTLVA
jgi:hypothetical protein